MSRVAAWKVRANPPIVFVHRQRAADQVTLQLVAAEQSERLLLLFFLDTFCNHTLTQRMRQLNDGKTGLHASAQDPTAKPTQIVKPHDLSTEERPPRGHRLGHA
jgi:lipase chaperone LimK